VLPRVISFASYGTNMVLYVTASTTAGEVDVNLEQGGTVYDLRKISADPPYQLDFTKYAGNWYYAIGDNVSNKIYIYENPVSELQGQPGQPIVPVYIMKIAEANYLAFSSNTQFIVAENSDNFAVYDADNAKGYAYTLTQPLAAAQHATWMDGDRLMLTSNSAVVIFDYDHANLQSLQPAIDGTVPMFDPTFGYMYSLANAPLVAGQTTAPVNFTSTPMLTP
jgi:hypothetical protein